MWVILSNNCLMQSLSLKADDIIRNQLVVTLSHDKCTDGHITS